MVAKDGTEIWKANKQMQYAPQNQNTGHPLANLIVAAVTAAMTRADPNYLPLAVMANDQVFTTDPTAIPVGPYRTVN